MKKTKIKLIPLIASLSLIPTIAISCGAPVKSEPVKEDENKQSQQPQPKQPIENGPQSVEDIQTMLTNVTFAKSLTENTVFIELQKSLSQLDPQAQSEKLTKFTSVLNEVKELIKDLDLVELSARSYTQDDLTNRELVVTKLKYPSLDPKLKGLRSALNDLLSDLIEFSEQIPGYLNLTENLNQKVFNALKNDTLNNLKDTTQASAVNISQSTIDNILNKYIEEKAKAQQWFTKMNLPKELQIKYFNLALGNTKAELDKEIAKNIQFQNAFTPSVEATQPSSLFASETNVVSNEASPNPPMISLEDFQRLISQSRSSRDIAANTYPKYTNKFWTLKSETLYKEIYDRTFSLAYGFNEYDPKAENGGNKDWVGTLGGTAWLLDYHKNTQNPNKYKLFLATNLHVIGYLSNTLTEEQDKHLNYFDPTGFKANGIALGKQVQTPSFAAVANNTRNNQNPIYYGNMAGFSTVIKPTGSYKNLDSVISNAKLIFAAVDFVKRSNVERYQESLLKAFDDDSKNSFEAKNTSIQKDRNVFDAKVEYQKQQNFVPFYQDFGVFAVDVDLTNADATFKSWITNATAAVDKQVSRKYTNLLPNNLDLLSPTPSMDYVSASKYLSDDKNTFKWKELILPNAKNLYIAGYPADQNKAQWMKNNPIERSSRELTSAQNSSLKNNNLFSLQNGTWTSRSINDGSNSPSLYKELWHRYFAQDYGYNLDVNFSSLYFGASGSMVLDEFGQTVGIYNLVSQNATFGDLLKPAKFTQLTLTNPVLDEGGKLLMPAYNLLDGSDQAKFPEQTRSFRQNLRYLYQNGFEDGDNKTALFPDGF